ncbi:MAG: DUF523 domain-containing protein [Coriobacteriales bacterium]|nr:DUF523 domain-containing protein [Coriobacteriales bacterium]
MKIMVSACLVGENCKYSGGNNLDTRVSRLETENTLIKICPEVLGGLPIPRIPVEIRDGIATTKDGRNVDAEFRAGAQKCLEIAKQEQPDLVILQPRSPSCGVRHHYDGTFSGTLVDGPGITAQLLMENGFKVIEPDDLGSFE